MEIAMPAEKSSTPMIVTAESRFVGRVIQDPSLGEGMGYIVRILQQKWVVDVAAAGVLLQDPDQYDEWRDVPYVEEVERVKAP